MFVRPTGKVLKFADALCEVDNFLDVLSRKVRELEWTDLRASDVVAHVGAIGAERRWHDPILGDVAVASIAVEFPPRPVPKLC